MVGCCHLPHPAALAHLGLSEWQTIIGDHLLDRFQAKDYLKYMFFYIDYSPKK